MCFCSLCLSLSHTQTPLSLPLSLSLYNTHTHMHKHTLFSLSTFFLFYFFSTFCFVDPPGSLQQFLCTPLQNKKIRVGKVLSNRMCCLLFLLWCSEFTIIAPINNFWKKSFLTIAKRWFISKLSFRPLLIINVTKKTYKNDIFYLKTVILIKLSNSRQVKVIFLFFMVTRKWEIVGTSLSLTVFAKIRVKRDINK